LELRNWGGNVSKQLARKKQYLLLLLLLLLIVASYLRWCVADREQLSTAESDAGL